MADPVLDWMATLEHRHLADLTFPEVARALRALSATYVEKRQRIATGSALSGAGKRAAFALFYAPLHYLLVREIVRTLPGTRNIQRLVDLGCGTGAAGAAWAGACSIRPAVLGIDRHAWALKEAAMTYRGFGLSGRTLCADVSDARVKVKLDRTPVLAAFVLNELPEASRERLLEQLVERNAGSPTLILEPLAGAAAPWWSRWRSRVEARGGRADEWRVRCDLPDLVRKFDRAAGLNHRELTGRTLWIGSTQ